MFQDMGIPFRVVVADIDETQMPGEQPVEFAMRAAGEKGLCVATRLAGENRHPWIVSADTIVLIDDQVLTKPVDDAHAREMLLQLSGRTHQVITGWAVGRHQGDWTVSHSRTAVTFHPLTSIQIDGYIATGEGRDKAGSYAIQDIGAFLVNRIEGDYFNVVGLPISQVVRTLLKKGALKDFLQP